MKLKELKHIIMEVIEESYDKDSISWLMNKVNRVDDLSNFTDEFINALDTEKGRYIVITISNRSTKTRSTDDRGKADTMSTSDVNGGRATFVIDTKTQDVYWVRPNGNWEEL